MPAPGAVTENRLFQVRSRSEDARELLPDTKGKKRSKFAREVGSVRNKPPRGRGCRLAQPGAV